MSNLDQAYAKMQAKNAYDSQTPANDSSVPPPPDMFGGCEAPETASGAVYGIGTGPSRLGYSLRDEAAKSAQYHQEQAVKLEKAAIFFSQHPEFEEFIRLIRSGSIQF